MLLLLGGMVIPFAKLPGAISAIAKALPSAVQRQFAIQDILGEENFSQALSLEDFQFLLAD